MYVIIKNHLKMWLRMYIFTCPYFKASSTPKVPYIWRIAIVGRENAPTIGYWNRWPTCACCGAIFKLNNKLVSVIVKWIYEIIETNTDKTTSNCNASLLRYLASRCQPARSRSGLNLWLRIDLLRLVNVPSMFQKRAAAGVALHRGFCHYRWCNFCLTKIVTRAHNYKLWM